MAWYKDKNTLTFSTGTGAHWSNLYGPGEKVPKSGIYKCTGCGKEITSNENDPFPPQNHHQHTVPQGAIRWKLIVRSNTEGK